MSRQIIDTSTREIVDFATSEAQKILQAVAKEKAKIDDALKSIRKAWNGIMHLASQPAEGDQPPPLFQWKNKQIISKVDESSGFLLKLLLDVELMEKRYEFSRRVRSVAALAQQQRTEPAQINITVPQGQAQAPPSPGLTAFLTQLVSRQKEGSPERIIMPNREVESILDNYKQFAPNWNRFIQWYYGTLDLVKLFPVQEVYDNELTVANEFLEKLRSQMMAGAIAAATSMKEKMDQRAERMVQAILAYAIGQRGRTFGEQQRF